MKYYKIVDGEFVELTAEEVEDNQAKIDAGNVRQKSGKLLIMTDDEVDDRLESQKPDKESLKSQLWGACTDYRKARISEEGMIRLSPFEITHAKAGQIALWISGLWGSPSDSASEDGSYYARRALIEEGGVPSMEFSNFGDLPISFAEAMQEILES